LNCQALPGECWRAPGGGQGGLVCQAGGQLLRTTTPTDTHMTTRHHMHTQTKSHTDTQTHTHTHTNTHTQTDAQTDAQTPQQKAHSERLCSNTYITHKQSPQTHSAHAHAHTHTHTPHTL